MCGQTEILVSDLAKQQNRLFDIVQAGISSCNEKKTEANGSKTKASDAKTEANGAKTKAKDSDGEYGEVPVSLSKLSLETTPTSPRVIFLTGSSGFLGSHLSTDLQKAFPQATIVLLVRQHTQSPNTLQKKRRQSVASTDSLKLIGDTSLVSSGGKVVLLVGDLSRPQFGQNGATFKWLCEHVDLICHCGAAVNHLLSFRDLYATNVASLEVIVAMATRHHIKPLHFISSSSFYKHKQTLEAGYGATKWACDHLLQQLRSRYKLPIFIYRPGLLCGNSQTGEVNQRDWLHRLLQAVLDFSIMPDTQEKNQCSQEQVFVTRLMHQPIGMVCVNDCSRHTVELIRRTSNFSSRSASTSSSIYSNTPFTPYIFNFTAENISFAEIFSVIQNHYQCTKVLPYPEFYQRLRELSQLHDHPVHCLIDRFASCLGAPPPPSTSPAGDMASVEAVLEQPARVLFQKLLPYQLIKQLELLRQSGALKGVGQV